MSLTVTECFPTPAHPHLSEKAILHQEQLRPHLDHPDTHDAATEALTRGLEGAREKFRHEMRGLTSTIGAIKKSFDDIGKELAPFDLQKQWFEYQATFNALLYTSRQNAANAAGVLRDFETLFEEDNQITKENYEDIKTEVQNLVKCIEKNRDEADAIEGKFKTLADEIHVFETVVEKAVSARTGDTFAELQRAREHVAELHARLTDVKSELTYAGLACFACLSAGAISAAFLFLTLSPVAAHAVVGSLLALVPNAIQFHEKMAEVKQLKKQIKAKCQEIAKLEEEETLLKEYHARLSKPDSSIKGICNKIDGILGIWHTLGADFMLLLGQLESIANPDTKFTKFINKRIAASRAMYAELRRLLQEYVVGVDSVPDTPDDSGDDDCDK